MSPLRLVEASDRWELELPGCSVTQCRLDYAFTILLDGYGGIVELRIGQPFEFRPAGGDAVTLVPEGEPTAMGSALAILRQVVERLVAFKDGALELSFADRSKLRVPTCEEFEPWDLVGPAGLRIVSLPGGELGIWRPDEVGAAAS